MGMRKSTTSIANYTLGSLVMHAMPIFGSDLQTISKGIDAHGAELRLQSLPHICRNDTLRGDGAA